MESKEHFIQRILNQLRCEFYTVQDEVREFLGDDLDNFDDFDIALSNLEHRLTTGEK